MTRMWMIGVLTTLLVSHTCIAADDAPLGNTPKPKPKQGTAVVLVGVGAFSDQAITARPTADADAKAFYDLFSDAKYGAVAKDRISLLTSEPDAARGGLKATRENVITALKAAVAKTGDEDLLIIGVFGRGASAAETTSIFTADTVFKERSKTSFLGSDLEAALKPAKTRKLLLMMDLSFKGFDAGKETIIEPSLRDVLGAIYGTDDKEDQLTIQDKVVMLATTPLNEPLTKGNNGLFTSTILDALKGAADVEGYAPDSQVTMDELFKYVDKKVPDELKALAKAPKDREALPYIVGEETSHFIITRNPAVAKQVDDRLAKIAGMEKGGTLNKELAVEGKTYLTRMPKLKALQELRKKYEALADGTLAIADFEVARAEIRKGMELLNDDADTFARKVRRASDYVKARYYKVVNSGEMISAAIKGMYRRIEEPFPPELELELKDAKNLSTDKLRELLVTARVKLGKREDLEGDKDADIAIMMMIASFNDPYTVYYDKDTLKKMEAPLRGQFSGIGIQIRRDLVKDGLLVVSPIKDSPAYKAGIVAGDVITEIRRDLNPKGDPLTSTEPKVISTKGMKTEQALDIILGKPGTPVTVVVDRESKDGKTEQKVYELKRGRVNVETVFGAKRKDDDSWDYFLDDTNKIGYIYLSQFTNTTASDLKAALDRLKAAGMKGLVLDLRFNPGGMLQAAVLICDLFIDEGLIVEIRPRVGQPEKYYDRGYGKYLGFPMTVLINGNSASASEIVSACLQDYGRAVVVGERSYGKGSVQQVDRFEPTSGEIKMTTARYFPPLGRNIDKHSSGGKPEDEWGVQPDKGFEEKLTKDEVRELAEHIRDHELIPRRDLPKKDAKPFKDKQLEKALEYLKGQLKTASKK